MDGRVIKIHQLKKKDKRISKRSAIREEKGHFIITLHRSTSQKDKTSINILTSNNRSHNVYEAKPKFKQEANNSTLLVGGLNILLSSLFKTWWKN